MNKLNVYRQLEDVGHQALTYSERGNAWCSQLEHVLLHSEDHSKDMMRRLRDKMVSDADRADDAALARAVRAHDDV